MEAQQFIFPFPCWWAFGPFPVILKKVVTVNITEQIFLDINFHFSWANKYLEVESLDCGRYIYAFISNKKVLASKAQCESYRYSIKKEAFMCQQQWAVSELLEQFCLENPFPHLLCIHLLGLPWWLSGGIHLPMQEPREIRFSPWVGKIPWQRKWQCTAVFFPGKSHG